jgi:hypothetical protein
VRVPAHHHPAGRITSGSVLTLEHMDEPLVESAADTDDALGPQYLSNCDPGDETAEVSEPPIAA